MNAKKESRLRRARRARAKIRELGAVRLCVNRTPRHIYAQIISADGGQVLASASTLDGSLRTGTTGNIEAATKRSEEHTSELQSRPHLVCRLLLEKKKATSTIITRVLSSH